MKLCRKEVYQQSSESSFNKLRYQVEWFVETNVDVAMSEMDNVDEVIDRLEDSMNETS